MGVKFEWDQAKSDKNLEERGFGFDFAALIFAGPTVESVDDRFDYGEVRVKAIGSAQVVILAVIDTDREDEVRRIISARKASKKEQDEWFSSV